MSEETVIKGKVTNNNNMFDIDINTERIERIENRVTYLHDEMNNFMHEIHMDAADMNAKMNKVETDSKHRYHSLKSEFANSKQKFLISLPNSVSYLQ